MLIVGLADGYHGWLGVGKNAFAESDAEVERILVGKPRDGERFLDGKDVIELDNRAILMSV